MRVQKKKRFLLTEKVWIDLCRRGWTLKNGQGSQLEIEKDQYPGKGNHGESLLRLRSGVSGEDRCGEARDAGCSVQEHECLLSVKDKTEKVGWGQIVRPGISNQSFWVQSCLLHPQLLSNAFCGSEAAWDIWRDRYSDCKMPLCKSGKGSFLYDSLPFARKLWQ